MDLKELYEKVETNWSQMRAHMDQQQDEIKKEGQERGETKSAVDKHSQEISALEDQIKELRSAASRPQLDWKGAMGGRDTMRLADVGTFGAPQREFKSKEDKQRYDLFWRGIRPNALEGMGPGEVKSFRQLYGVRRGGEDDTRLNNTALALAVGGVIGGEGPDESKALSLGDDTAGGYLAPPEFIQDIIKGVQLISPIRPMAQVRQTSRRSVQYPVRSGVFAARWTQETGTRTETAGLTYALEEIPNHEMYALVFVSDQDLEDAVFNLEQEILDNATEQFAKAEGAAFVSGTAIGQPEGLLTNTAVTTDNYTMAASGANAHTLGPSMFLSTWGNLKTVYSKNATWLMNRASIVQVRGLVDGQGRYLWEPGLADGTPPNLLGSPYVEIPDMPNVPSSSGNATCVVYGNIKRAYLIVDRIQVVVRRLQEKYAESGQIAYLIRKRVGGQVVLPEAIRRMNVTFA